MIKHQILRAKYEVLIRKSFFASLYRLDVEKLLVKTLRESKKKLRKLSGSNTHSRSAILK
jgi:hypothetical protein